MTLSISNAKFTPATKSDWVSFFTNSKGAVMSGTDSSDNGYYWAGLYGTYGTYYSCTKVSSVDGSVVWSKNITPPTTAITPPATTAVWFYGGSACSSNGYTAASFYNVDNGTSTLYVNIVLLDSNGNFMFSTLYTTGYVNLHNVSMAVDNSGNVFVYSKFFNSSTGGLIKFNSSGTRIWENNINSYINPGNGGYSLYSMHLDSNNNPVIAWVIDSTRIYVNTIDAATGFKLSGVDHFSIALTYSGYSLRNIDFALTSAITTGGYILIWGELVNNISSRSVAPFITLLQCNGTSMSVVYSKLTGGLQGGLPGQVSAIPVGTSGDFLILTGPKYTGGFPYVNGLTLLSSNFTSTDYTRLLGFESGYDTTPPCCCCGNGTGGYPFLAYSSTGGIIVSYCTTRDSRTRRVTMKLNDNIYPLLRYDSFPPPHELRVSSISLGGYTFPMKYGAPYVAFTSSSTNLTTTIFDDITNTVVLTNESFSSSTLTLTDSGTTTSTLSYKYF